MLKSSQEASVAGDKQEEGSERISVIGPCRQL